MTSGSTEALQADVATELLHSLLLDDPAAWWTKLDEILGRLEARGLCAWCAVYVRHRRRAAVYRCMAASPGAALLRSQPLGPEEALVKRMLSTPEGTHPSEEASMARGEPGHSWWTKRYPASLAAGESPQFFAVSTLAPGVARAVDSTLSEIFTSVFAALRATLTAAEKAWMRESRDTIAYLVRHDLRGPLHAIDLNASALEDLSEEYARYRDALIRTVHRVMQGHETLVERLYVPLATEAERTAERWFYRPTVGPWPSVLRIVEAYRFPGRVDVSAPDDRAYPEYSVQVDSTRLDLALKQVVDNAINHGHSDKPVHIELSIMAAVPQQLTITVRDHGRGIPVAERSAVFDDGYRATTTRRERSSQGVGLTVAQAIIEDHGGRIWIDPDLPMDVGTCVVIQLPLEKRS